MDQIVGAIEQDTGLTVPLRTAYQVIRTFMLPDLGIAKEIMRHPLGSTDDRITFILVKVNTVIAPCQALVLLKPFAIIGSAGV